MGKGLGALEEQWKRAKSAETHAATTSAKKAHLMGQPQNKKFRGKGSF